jgi:deoxycytidine triphosphate deaminase
VTVLGRSEIEKRLREGVFRSPQIFKRGTWTEDNLRGAAYDLRIASDFLITPDGRRYWTDAEPGFVERKKSFTLGSGDVAFVSTVEEIYMPADLVGNIAPRFRYALEGLVVMGGMLVDPDYVGRLHFQLANLGKEPFVVEPGTTAVAAIQFLPVIGKTRIRREQVPNSQNLLDQLFYRGVPKEPLTQLAFFSETTELQGRVNRVKDDVEDQKIKWSVTSRSTDQLLVFGVFLLSITLFTVAIAAIVDALAGGSFKDAGNAVQHVDFTLAGIVVCVALLAVVGLACRLMMRPVFKMIERHEDEAAADRDRIAAERLARETS